MNSVPAVTPIGMDFPGSRKQGSYRVTWTNHEYIPAGRPLPQFFSPWSWYTPPEPGEVHVFSSWMAAQVMMRELETGLGRSFA